MTDTITANDIGAQGRALASIARVAGQHPNLPGAYITCSSISPNQVTLLLEHPADLEAWREALLVAPEDVVRGKLRDQEKLSFETTVDRVDVHVWVAFTLAAVQAEGAAA